MSYAAVSSNIAWYMGGTYASYRYLRPTSVEAAVLVIMALFSMFRGTTLLTYIWPPFYDIGVWIETVVATSVIRAFTTAMSVGTIVLVIRALVGKEPGLIELELT